MGVNGYMDMNWSNTAKKFKNNLANIFLSSCSNLGFTNGVK